MSGKVLVTVSEHEIHVNSTPGHLSAIINGGKSILDQVADLVARFVDASAGAIRMVVDVIFVQGAPRFDQNDLIAALNNRWSFVAGNA